MLLFSIWIFVLIFINLQWRPNDENDSRQRNEKSLWQFWLHRPTTTTTQQQKTARRNAKSEKSRSNWSERWRRGIKEAKNAIEFCRSENDQGKSHFVLCLSYAHIANIAHASANSAQFKVVNILYEARNKGREILRKHISRSAVKLIPLLMIFNVIFSLFIRRSHFPPPNIFLGRIFRQKSKCAHVHFSQLKTAWAHTLPRETSTACPIIHMQVTE